MRDQVRYGSPLGAGFGNPENDIAFLGITPAAGGAPFFYLTFRPADGRGDAWFGIYVNCMFVRNVRAAEGEMAGPFVVGWPRGATQVSLAAIRLGQVSDPSYHIERVARTFEGAACRRVTVEWTWTPEIVGTIKDGGQTSGWQLAGVTFSKTAPVQQIVPVGGTWTQFTFDIVVASGTCTVSLYRQNTLVAQGTIPLASLPGVVALSEVAGSGISGQVTVAAGVTLELGALLILRWPTAMQITRGTSDPPSAIVATVPFNSADTCEWTEPVDLPAGTYYYRLDELSDTGEPGAATATLQAVVQGPPLPPAGLHYVSGNYLNTIVGWTDSPTPNAAYNVYSREDGQPFRLNQPDSYPPLPHGTTQFQLANFYGYYPGFRFVLVRSVLAGVEEKNIAILRIEYDGEGNVVPARPNAPAIDTGSLAITAGRSVALTGLYPSAGEPGVATELQLFSRTVTGDYDFDNPDATATLGAAGTNGIKTAALSKTYGSDGPRYVCLRAVTADGTPGNTSAETLIDPNADAMPAPEDAEIYVARG
jgi:hypothetical protein